MDSEDLREAQVPLSVHQIHQEAMVGVHSSLKMTNLDRQVAIYPLVAVADSEVQADLEVEQGSAQVLTLSQPREDPPLASRDSQDSQAQ